MNAKNLALNLLIKAKDLASSTLDKFRGGVGRTTEKADQLDTSLKHVGDTTDRLADLLTEAERAAGRFYDKSGRLREANGRFVQGATTAAQRAKQLGKELDGIPGSADHASTSIGGLTSKIIALAGTYLGLSALKNALTGLVNVGSRFEDMQVQLNTLMGSIEKGEQATAWIKDFATNTPADIAGVTEGFIKLKAFGIDPMNGSYRAIMDQTAKLGFSQEKLDGVILAVGQAWTKQKLQGEEALQLIERGVPVWDLLANATGRTAVELQDMASAGQLGRREIALLIQEMGKSSEGASAAAMRTWTGLVSNLKDMWLNFVNDINEAGFLEYMKEQLKALLDQVKQMAADGSLKRWAKDISDSLISVAEGLKSVITTTAEWGKEIAALAAVLVTLKLVSMAKGLLSIAQNMRTAATATTSLGTATTGLSGAASGLNSAWGWVTRAGTGLKNLAGYLVKGGRLLTGIGLLAAGVKLVADRWREAWRAEQDAQQQQQNTVLEAMQRQQKYLDAMNTQLKTEEELGRISREGYEAYKQRLENAQAYWQARVDAEKGEIALGHERAQQRDEAQAQLDKYIAAEQNLKAIVKDANKLKSQGLSEQAALHQQLTEQLDEETDKTTKQASETDKLGAAYETLGLNVAILKNQVTEQGKAAAEAFALVGREGDLSSEQITDAFNRALSETTTVADAELLREKLKQLREDGKLTGREYQDAMRDVNAQIKKLKDGTSDASDETKQLNKEVENLNDVLEEGSKAGKGHIGELTTAMKELADVVKTLAGEYQNAAEHAENLKDQEARESGSRRSANVGSFGGNEYYELMKGGNTEAAALFRQMADAYGDTLEGLVLAPKYVEDVVNPELKKLQQQALQQTRVGTDTSAPANSTAPAPGKTMRVEFSAAGQNTVAGDFDEGSADQLVRMLGEIGSVTG